MINTVNPPKKCYAAINNNKCLSEQKDCNLRGADSGSNPNWALERTNKLRVYKGKTPKM